jgi:hypothetical protein
MEGARKDAACHQVEQVLLMVKNIKACLFE